MRLKRVHVNRSRQESLVFECSDREGAHTFREYPLLERKRLGCCHLVGPHLRLMGAHSPNLCIMSIQSIRRLSSMSFVPGTRQAEMMKAFGVGVTKSTLQLWTNSDIISCSVFPTTCIE
jgi:hypothetical protein